MTDRAPRIPIIDIPDEPDSSLGILFHQTKSGVIKLPLASVDYRATVAECIAEVTVTEKFKNPYANPIEVIYCFPLPGSACVSKFEMKVGERIVSGRVDERKAARADYAQALAAGKRTALLEQDRDSVFTVQVGNIPAGEEITVMIIYSEKLPFFEDGKTELRLPLVVAEKYIPGHPTDRNPVGEGVELDTGIVPDASRISPPRLAPGADPGCALNINVEISGRAADDKYLEVEEISCSQHATKTSLKNGAINIALARVSERLNRDFVLRWAVSGQSVDSQFLVFKDREGNRYGMVSICPPKQTGYLGMPRDVVFVLDRSGSMNGSKMASASKACSILLNTLGPADRFAIVAFDTQLEWHQSGQFSKADESGIARGDAFLRGIDARGGTEMFGAIDDALARIKKANNITQRAPVIVLITDGQIGDEHRILKLIQTTLGDTRIFTVGVDTAVNEGFLNRLASVGGGTATFVEPGHQLEEALRAVAREIGQPLITNISIDAACDNLIEDSLTPQPVPDVFAGRSSTLYFRLTGNGKRTPPLTITGMQADGTKFTRTVKSSRVSLPALAQLWAKARVADLEDSFRAETLQRESLRREIIETALKHSLLTRFTAFVVIDDSEIVNKEGEIQTVVQPVEMADGWGCAPHFGAQSGVAPLASAPMQSPPPSGGGGGSWGGPAAGLTGGYGSIAPAAAGWGLMPRSQEPHPFVGDRDSKDELKKLAESFRSFVRELEDVISKLKGDCVPPYQPLEKTRFELLTILAGLNISSKLGLLQSLLRSDTRTLVHALSRPGIETSALVTLIEKLEYRLQEVEEEFKLALAGCDSSGNNNSAFWEISI